MNPGATHLNGNQRSSAQPARVQQPSWGAGPQQGEYSHCMPSRSPAQALLQVRSGHRQPTAALRGTAPGLPSCAFPATFWVLGPEALTCAGAKFSVANAPSSHQVLQEVHDPHKMGDRPPASVQQDAPFLRTQRPPQGDSSTRWNPPWSQPLLLWAALPVGRKPPGKKPPHPAQAQGIRVA